MARIVARDRDAALLFWMAAAAALLAVRVVPNGFMPGIAHDTFQYFSVAEQALRGRIGETALVHFDAERTFGQVPAPLVTFPSGFPLLVALFGMVGLSLPHAALLANTLAALACVPILWWATGELALPRALRHCVVAAVVANGALLLFATTASTEMLFTLLVLAGSALLLRARRNGARMTPMPWVVAGLCFGIAYHVRYAGIFLVVALGAVAARHVVLRRDRVLGVGHVVATLTGALVIAAGMLRNIVLVGNWRGGNEKAVSNPLADVAEQTLRAFNGLVLGPMQPGRSEYVLRGAFVALALVAVVLLLRGRGAGTSATTERPTRDFGVDLAIIAGVYSALMMYAGLTTVISYGTRMFVPIVPLLALLVGCALAAMLPSRTPTPARSPLGLALAATLLAYVVVNLASLRIPSVDRASVVEAQLRARVAGGPTLRQVIDSVAGSQGIIVANSGQALGYLLDRRTVSLVGPHYSSTSWTEDNVRAVVERYGASAVVITARLGTQAESSDLIPSPFVAELAQGRAPSWLRLVSHVGPIFVYVPDASVIRS